MRGLDGKIRREQRQINRRQPKAGCPKQPGSRHATYIRRREQCESAKRRARDRSSSASVLGAAASDLAVVKCFFVDPWNAPHPSLPPPAQAWVLRDVAVNLEIAGRLDEALEPLRIAVRQTVALGASREIAASRRNDLSRLELTVGRNESRYTNYFK